jgi:uncharacterized protein (TIGR02145 family)
VTLTATFAFDAHILYFDSNNRLQVGAWGVQVNATNIAYFKFGSVVGFTMTGSSDSWDSGDIKFNPVTDSPSYTTYTDIPAWNTYEGTEPETYSITTNEDYISSSSYHTRDNVEDGYGDPCQLVGFSGAEINSRATLPIATYRLPTIRENESFIGYIGDPTTGNVNSIVPVSMSGSSPQIGTFKSGNALPALGYRSSGSGTAYNWGAHGYYWSATPVNNSDGYNIYFFASSYLYAGGTDPAQNGYPIRCVAK